MKFSNISVSKIWCERKILLAVAFGFVLLAGAAILAIMMPRMKSAHAEGGPGRPFSQDVPAMLSHVLDIDNCLNHPDFKNIDHRRIRPTIVVGRNQVTHTLWYEECGGIKLVVFAPTDTSGLDIRGESFEEASKRLASELWSAVASISNNAALWGRNEPLISMQARMFHDRAASYGMNYRVSVHYRTFDK